MYLQGWERRGRTRASGTLVAHLAPVIFVCHFRSPQTIDLSMSRRNEGNARCTKSFKGSVATVRQHGGNTSLVCWRTRRDPTRRVRPAKDNLTPDHVMLYLISNWNRIVRQRPGITYYTFHIGNTGEVEFLIYEKRMYYLHLHVLL